ncbi:ABC transporter permease [Actinomycetaceae bacterium TAE3-ERU4]|nr:ABC transporter permease [Actinomycetaceae bacterium TAE3-ERU4]
MSTEELKSVPASEGDKLTPQPEKKISAFGQILRAMTRAGVGTVALAIALSLLIGATLVVVFNPRVVETAGYLFARPSDFFSAVSQTFIGFFAALIRGALFDWEADSFAGMIRPLTDSLTFATPLIIAGLAVTVAFRAGLFNIGVQGQIIFGGIFLTAIAVNWNLPPVIAILVAILAAIVGGGIWGAIPGALKAKFGANEVIVTIMLNTIALQFVSWMLTQRILIGDELPSKSMAINKNAWYPHLLGSSFRLHFGFIVAIAAAVFVWWILERSTFGFELRAAGANPSAAATAGINVNRVIFLTMVLSGALAGLAATAPILGTEHYLTGSTQGSLGFDAITVALLGRSTPFGAVLAGLLFGSLNAAGSTLQTAADIPSDIVQITQAIIVLLIAASEALKYFKAKKVAAQKAAAKTLKNEEADK